jgi:PE family
MNYVIAAPEMMTAAATDLATIGSNVSAAHMVAAARTTSVIPAAADEVSAAIAQVFSRAAQEFQGLAGQAAAFNDRFVQHLAAAAGSYTSAEAAIASLLQGLQNLPNVIADALAAPFPGQAALASFGSALLQGLGASVGAIARPLLNLIIAAVSQLLENFGTFVFSNPELLYPLLFILGAPPFLLTITSLVLFLFVANALAQLGL